MEAEKGKVAVWLLLAASVALSLWTHSLVLEQFIAPTFGNTGVHFAAMRHIIEHQEYPMDDYSYGGGVTNLYVPLYRTSAASLSLLTGLSLDATARLLVLIIAVLLPLGFYSLGRALFGSPWPGVAAAFLVSAIPELLFYTVRPLPQAMGHALLPLAWYALATRKWGLALLLAFLTSLVHQEAAVYQAGVAFAFGALSLAAWFLERGDKGKEWLDLAKLGFAVWAVATLAYLGWHYAVAGGPNIWELAQFKHHEGNPLELQAFWDKSGATLAVLAAAGIALLAWKLWKWPSYKEAPTGAVFALALLGVGLFAVKNDVVGIRVFMDRFLVYLQQSLLPLAGLALAWIGERASKVEV